MTLYVGEGPRGSNGTRSTPRHISVTPSPTHNQVGLLWCWFLTGWACAHSRPLWVSPMTSPVRLGVSPAATPTPTGVFNQRFEALFPHATALGYDLTLSPPFVPHSANLGTAVPRQLNSSLPRLPVSAPPTGLDECLFFMSLVLDFLAFRFSVSSGCARRRSVSTYAAILVLL